MQRAKQGRLPGAERGLPVGQMKIAEFRPLPGSAGPDMPPVNAHGRPIEAGQNSAGIAGHDAVVKALQNRFRELAFGPQPLFGFAPSLLVEMEHDSGGQDHRQRQQRSRPAQPESTAGDGLAGSLPLPHQFVLLRCHRLPGCLKNGHRLESLARE